MNSILLAWGATVSRAFGDRVLQVCIELGWGREHASWLMACMAFESGLSPSVRNAAGSGATGLIQFMPRTAMYLGTTTELLAQMTAVEQLAYVKRYFVPYAIRVHTLSDMYMAILLPSAVGKPEDHVLFWQGTPYRQNAGLDTNHDGKITKAEASAKVAANLVRGMRAGSAASFTWPGP